MYQKELSICVFIDSKDNEELIKNEVEYRDLISKFSEHFQSNVELNLILLNHHEENVAMIKESIKEIPLVATMKLVTTIKFTKYESYRNISWQCSTGDHVLYAESLSKLKGIYRAIYDNQLPLINSVFYNKNCTNSKKIDKEFRLISDSYNGQTSFELSSDLSGFLIDRSTINTVFYNELSVVDSYVQLALTKLSFARIKIEADETPVLYSDLHDCFIVYCKSENIINEELVAACQLSGLEFIFPLTLILVFTLPNLLKAVVFFLLYYLVYSILKATYYLVRDHFTLTKYAIGAASDKKLAGQYRIELVTTSKHNENK